MLTRRIDVNNDERCEPMESSMTNSKELPAPGGQADGAYYNVWLTIPKVDAGVMTNQARAKLSYGGWLEPGAPIVFTIMSGSAVFAGGLKTTTVTTDSFGCAYVAFSDTGTDAGEMKAAMQNNTDVSDKAPYSFGGGASSGFNIALSAIVDDAPADGTSDDQGRALVTYGGGPLQDRQNVQFVFGAGSSAVFETDKPDVQAGSTGSKLIVKTHVDEHGNDIADAYFHDASGEQVTLVATLVDHPEVAAGTLAFTFTAAQRGFEIGLSRVTDDAPADGTSDDQGRALVTYGGGPLQDRQNVQFVFGAGSSAVFETDKPDVQAGSTGSKLIVKTHVDEHGNDIADAYFHDASGEQVTLVATLVDHPEVAAQTLAFTFTAAAPRFDIALNRVTDGAPADGSSEDQGRAVVTENGGPLQAPKIVKFSCEMGSSARFDTTKPQGYVQSNSNPTVLYVKTHFDSDAKKDVADAYFMDNTAEAVTLVATLDGDFQTNPQTQPFQFTAPLTYSLGLSSMTPGGVPGDGISENFGRAIVSCELSKLPSPQTVKFELLGEGTFDTRGADVLPGSDNSTLYVKTHNDGRQDVAYAYFTDSGAGNTTLRASLPDHPTVQERSTDFRFNSPAWPYAVALTSLTLDGVPADGKSENHALAVVSYGGKAYGHTFVRFELVGAWGAKFDTTKPDIYSSTATTLTVSTHTDEQGRDVADAYFTDTSAEMVTLTATFPEYSQQGGSPASRYFFFSAGGDEQE